MTLKTVAAGRGNDKRIVSDGISDFILEAFHAERQEHAPPLAGTSVETGMEVHVTGHVDDEAASGSCCVSSCSLGLFWKWAKTAALGTFYCCPSFKIFSGQLSGSVSHESID